MAASWHFFLPKHVRQAVFLVLLFWLNYVDESPSQRLPRIKVWGCFSSHVTLFLKEQSNGKTSHSQTAIKMHNKRADTQYIGLFEHHSLPIPFFFSGSLWAISCFSDLVQQWCNRTSSFKRDHKITLQFVKMSQNSHRLLLLCKLDVKINPGHPLQTLPFACNVFYQMLNTVTYGTLYINTNSSVTAISLFTDDLAFS